MGNDDASPVTFEERVLATSTGSKAILIVTPRVAVVAGRARLEELRDSLRPGAIDRTLLRRVRAGKGRIQALLLRGASDDGAGSWKLDPRLTAAERAEMGYLMAKSHLPNHRRFMACGVFVYLHTDFGPNEVEMFRGGADRLADELAMEAKQSPDDPVLRVDLWILRNLSFWFGLSAARVLESVLPEQLPLFEARIPRIKEMIATLPLHAR